MAMIKDPLRGNARIRINDHYDNNDVIIENALSRKKKFIDMDNPNLLTQNNWNTSPNTRVNAYRDVTLLGAKAFIEGRFERYKWKLNPEKYRD